MDWFLYARDLLLEKVLLIIISGEIQNGRFKSLYLRLFPLYAFLLSKKSLINTEAAVKGCS